ncbi:MAG: sodium:alanine symporter family protein [Novosphingobium sp.]|nr:sodium:alanine symporter family protein [Novosphingobium sp.]MCP5404313.1 sodium:alanine symporter family protein [Novosphingobium sp.]
MDQAALTALLGEVSSFVWGTPLLVLLLGTGLYLTFAMRFMPVRRIGTAFRLLFRGRHPGAEPGDITPFQTLMTALAATIGTGNIAGVATAIALGGPGAVFWMWMTALVGMATKYAEAVLAVNFREVDADGRHVGGPMYYIRNGLGKNWGWLAFLFALFAALAGLGIGNMVQANSVVAVMKSSFGLSEWVVGVVLATLVFAVIIGGVKRIGAVAEYLVPFMAVAYVLGGLTVIALNWQDIPEGLAFIVRSAFTPTAATGGFAGAAIWAGIRFGVARGVFSNEAGLGSAAIAHAAAKTKDPVQQGMIAMLGTFIDTLLVCTITALVIVTVHVPVEMGDGSTQMMAAWASGQTGAELTSLAFGAGLPGVGQWIVTFGLVLFAFTTMLSWSYYGERSAEYLFGVRVVLPYRYLWVVFVFLGSVAELKLVWTVTDILNGLMAVPNLIALLLLSGTVIRLTRGSAAASSGKLPG